MDKFLLTITLVISKSQFDAFVINFVRVSFIVSHRSYLGGDSNSNHLMVLTIVKQEIP